MPCESCSVEFTVFRRKRSCEICRRYYCNNCLTVTKRCQRCAIFAKRPLLRADLLKLKTKDLIFYLQSKHISTEGCLEKEELVGLVLAHVAHMDRSSPPNGTPHSPGRGQPNPIDSLKQTCQNFFTNLSDNISDSFASFDTKAGAKPDAHTTRHSSSADNGPPSHIFEQPRVSTREIPTYASSVNSNSHSQSHGNGFGPTSPPAPPTEQVHVHVSDSSHSASTSSAAATPNTSASPQEQGPGQPQIPAAAAPARAEDQAEQYKSDCECSDDEIITTFSERLSQKAENSASGQAKPNSAGLGPSTATTTTTTSTSPGYSKQGSLSSKVDACGADVSSQSSFEELGAIGGISDESKAATDTNSSNLDQWQLLEVCRHEQPGAAAAAAAAEISPSPTPLSATEEILEVTLRSSGALRGAGETLSIEQHPAPQAPQRTKKVIRRRSDGYLNRRHHSSDDDESPVAAAAAAVMGLSTLREHPEQAVATGSRSSCQRCGKNKSNIRRHVERMRQHLESSQMSEEEIKRELQEFLSYLELRTKSLDCSDADSHAVSPLSGEAGSSVAGAGGRGVGSGMPVTPTIEFSPTQDDTQWDDDEGIHVYAAPPDYEPAAGIDSRFINLEDFEDIKDLENLTVKQLKEVLMLHRVDYKGCCEKQELLDRVSRLWSNMRSTPAVEKLATDELCKICMDAPIECVFLECGHMATCTSCGKVLNECPICRQYIVRVVRFFRA